MRISSQFKDYYDYVAHLYGGGDPSILYLRNRLSPLSDFGTPTEVTVKHSDVFGLPNPYHKSSPSSFWMFKWLAVCGKYYLLVSKVNYGEVDYAPWEILDKKKHQNLFERLTGTRRFDPPKPENYWVGNFQPGLVELSRKINAPVFTFSPWRDGTVHVDGEIPILADLDFHRFYHPDQMYQELSYFLGNVIKESPDMMPATNMTDKEKISQHGFDIKQSFRHRK